MEAFFDRLAMILGSGLSRRQAFTRAAGAMLGVVLSGFGPTRALAAAVSPCRHISIDPCQNIGCLKGHFDCGCVPEVRGGEIIPGRGFCHRCQLCDGLRPCTRSAECRAVLGRGWKCGASCCGVGFCLPRCRIAESNCELAGLGRGMTSLG